MSPITPSTVERAGMSKAGFYRAVRNGDFHRVSRGIYLPADSPAADWDMVEAVGRRADATICLTSALAQHDLIDTIPDLLDIAIPRGERIPVSDGAISWHHFDAETFSLGREELSISGSDTKIGLYSPERAIADAFRLRGQIGYELARDALKEWLRRGGKPNSLMQIAVRLPRAKSPVLQALEVLS